MAPHVSIPVGRADPLRSLSEICRTTPERMAVCRPMLPTIDDVAKYLSRIDASRRYSNHGALLLEFQDRLRDVVGRAAHVAVAASGTAALTGAILAAAGRAKPRRNLCFLPAYTFIGTVAAIEQCGYTPYFVDVDPETWMIDASRCAKHPLLGKVGLVLPVAPYGRPVLQADWKNFSAQNDIPVVIDGAAAFEGLVADPTSYLGSVPVAVSFHATKSFCTGEGGAIFCSHAEFRQTAVQCLNFGYDSDRVCRLPSINGKMSEYHAAIGLAELDRWRGKRLGFKKAAELYRSGFTSITKGRLHLSPSIASNYTLFEAQSAAQADALVDAFGQAGIGHRAWYGRGVHRQPYCQAFARDEVPVTDDLAIRLIGLPMSVDLAQTDVDLVCSVLKEVVAKDSADRAWAVS